MSGLSQFATFLQGSLSGQLRKFSCGLNLTERPPFIENLPHFLVSLGERFFGCHFACGGMGEHDRNELRERINDNKSTMRAILGKLLLSIIAHKALLLKKAFGSNEVCQSQTT